MTMNDQEMLKNIEYLRERADVSYEEAEELLIRYDGNLMRALVELERQGRIRPQNAGARAAAGQPQKPASKEPGFLSKALSYRIVVEDKKRKVNDKPETVANFSALYCGAATLVAPHVALGSLALSFVMGYHVRLSKRKAEPIPSDVNAFVDQTVSNIKTAATSFAQSAREAASGETSKSEEENEVTVE